MKNLPYQSPRGLDIREIKGKGRGVIAARKIRAGEIIETAPALLIPKAEAKVLGESFLQNYIFTSDNQKHLVIGLGITSMLNHDDDANAEFFVTHDQITIKAKKAIPVGTEITLNYRWGDGEWAKV